MNVLKDCKKFCKDWVESLIEDQLSPSGIHPEKMLFQEKKHLIELESVSRCKKEKIF